uniref:HHLA1 neighbor of OC90 n=1 Tax=Sciurus vulgaris TaxID=55149 RepID=A0A8D2D422_SCIVU
MPSFPLHGPPLRLCMGLACVLSLWNTVSGIKGGSKKEKGMTFLPITVSVLRGEERKEKGVAFLDTTEVPARSVDLSALNLMELVNGMLSRALKDDKTFLSLLSVTSYSSFAFHKFSVAVYNISNLKTVDPARFPTRYCYCLNNRTNDLSDFTALLVDITGNSTSYLTEIFKSTSILSVSQTNGSDCLFICVMAGESGRNLSDFWEMVEKSPVINYTFTSSLSGVLGAAATKETAETSKPTAQSQQALPRTGPPHRDHSTHQATALRTFPRRKTTSPSEEEATAGTGRLPGPPAGTTATAASASATHPASATGTLARTQWATSDRQTWAPALSTPRAQTKDETTPGGPPWGTPSSTPTSAEAAGATNKESLQGPAGAMATPSSPAPPGPTSGTVTPGTQTPRPTKAPAPKDPQTGEVAVEWPFAPGEEPALIPVPHQVSRCPQPLLKEGVVTAAPLTLAIWKLNRCLMELCRFFQQCLCRSQRDPRTETMRYCLEYYSWFLKNATFICQRVKRVSPSNTLKQKCLESVCESV